MYLVSCLYPLSFYFYFYFFTAFAFVSVIKAILSCGPVSSGFIFLVLFRISAENCSTLWFLFMDEQLCTLLIFHVQHDHAHHKRYTTIRCWKSKRLDAQQQYFSRLIDLSGTQFQECSPYKSNDPVLDQNCIHTSIVRPRINMNTAGRENQMSGLVFNIVLIKINKNNK